MQRFKILETSDGLIEGLYDQLDPVQMNWATGRRMWGETKLPEGIQCVVERTPTQKGRLIEKYTFKNAGQTDFFNNDYNIEIYIPLADNYASADVCMQHRCHVHIWCAENTTYLAALRMGGELSNLGMVCSEGSFKAYSIERAGSDKRMQCLSNDRGVFRLHPEINHLLPGEEQSIVLEWFWFDSLPEFYKQVQSQRHIWVELERAVYFEGEMERIRIHSPEPVQTYFNGQKVHESKSEYSGTDEDFCEIKKMCSSLGEHLWQISAEKQKTWAKTLVLPSIYDLVTARCRFIAEKQQYHNPNSCLDGAFLIYDNESESVYYSENPDHNGARERVGMGVLLATYLQFQKNADLEQALDKYTRYIYRELYDSDTGTVYNNVRRNNEWHRLYNYPWIAVFFMERYKLYHNETDLMEMYKVLCAYYALNGHKFYAIGIPMFESLKLLEKAGKKELYQTLKNHYRNHVDTIAERSLNYPSHEVNYEQSIVAPAVTYLLEFYRLTGEKKYLEEGEKQLKVLELFNGHQPDYHMYETAIRHWDGYWFGKRKQFGDTFSHYWSALSGVAFRNYELITGESRYAQKAENSLRGVLSLFSKDGRASCAYLYPFKINDFGGEYYDPWANDQDWALYFYIKMGSCKLTNQR